MLSGPLARKTILILEFSNSIKFAVSIKTIQSCCPYFSLNTLLETQSQNFLQKNKASNFITTRETEHAACNLVKWLKWTQDERKIWHFFLEYRKLTDSMSNKRQKRRILTIQRRPLHVAATVPLFLVMFFSVSIWLEPRLLHT